MARDGLPYNADRPRGIFGRRDREYLLGELGIEPRTQRDREIRSDIRQRIWHGLLDMILLYQCVERRDIEQALEDITPEESLDRNKAIGNGIALFIDLGSGKEVNDNREFERFVERAATISWQQRHASDEDDVWMGGPRPHANLSIEYPDRIDPKVLMRKVQAIYEQYEAAENPDEADLGLDSLSADEVLYSFSLVGSWERQPAEAVPDGLLKRVDMLEDVAIMWVVREYDQRSNVSGQIEQRVMGDNDGSE